MSLPFIIVPIFFGIVVLLILSQAVVGIAEWLRNNSLPVLSETARVVSKRMDVRRRASSNVGANTFTLYFVTFQFKSGERLEFRLQGQDFGLLAEGDEGILTYQGTRYHGFERQI